MKHALITGIAGQDGCYLASFLLGKGYRVYGLMKSRTSLAGLKFLKIFDHSRLHLIDGDITDSASVNNALLISQPDEIYNLAAQSHVGYSFKVPQLTCGVNYMGYLNVILGARKWAPNARIYQAGTSEMFGYAANGMGQQDENTPLQPMSPYGISKVAAHWAGVNARYEANQFISNGILFNHESPLREISFVTRKIVDVAVRQLLGEDKILLLGNIDARRDWGHAEDYVRAMWMMLQQDKPDDFVVATGETRSVREFVEIAFKSVGKEITFEGSGTKEVGSIDGKVVMKIDENFYRPNDLNCLCGNSNKARTVLGWKPKLSFSALIDDMVCSEMDKNRMTAQKQISVVK